MAKISKKRMASNNKWTAENYTNIGVSIPNAEMDALREHCAKFGYTRSGFVRAAIADKIKKDIAKREAGDNGRDT